MSALEYELTYVDDNDRQMLSLGFSRLIFPTPRMAKALDLACHIAEEGVKEMRASGRTHWDIVHLVGWRYPRPSRGSKRKKRDREWTEAFRTKLLDGRDQTEAENRAHRNAMLCGVIAVTIDPFILVEPPSIRALDFVQISVVDYGEKRFLVDHAARVHKDGRVTIYGPSLPAMRRTTGAPS